LKKEQQFSIHEILEKRNVPSQGHILPKLDLYHSPLPHSKLLVRNLILKTSIIRFNKHIPISDDSYIGVYISADNNIISKRTELSYH